MNKTLAVGLFLVALWSTPAHAITVDFPSPLPAITQGQPVTISVNVSLNGLAGETSLFLDVWSIGTLSVVGFPTPTGSTISLTGVQTASLPTGSVAVGYTAVTNTFSSATGTTSVQINPVPEPSTFVLAGVGLVAAALRRRRQLALQAAEEPDAVDA